MHLLLLLLLAVSLANLLPAHCGTLALLVCPSLRHPSRPLMPLPLPLPLRCRYFDAVVNSASGEPTTIPKAICMHEEDTGTAWKQVDYRTGKRRRLAAQQGKR